MVYIYTTDEQINPFTIGYMINPPLHINQVLREQVENFIRSTFYENTMETIRVFMKKKNICFITLIMFYEIKGENV